MMDIQFTGTMQRCQQIGQDRFSPRSLDCQTDALTAVRYTTLLVLWASGKMWMCGCGCHMLGKYYADYLWMLWVALGLGLCLGSALGLGIA